MDNLTKFEIARLLGIRATQIANGALSTVEVGQLSDPLEIASKELEKGKLPLVIVRRFPDGKINEQKCSAVDISNLF